MAGKNLRVNMQIDASIKAQEAELKKLSSEINRYLGNFDFGANNNKKLLEMKKTAQDISKIIKGRKEGDIITDRDTKKIQDAFKSLTSLTKKFDSFKNSMAQQGFAKFSNNAKKEFDKIDKELSKLQDDLFNLNGVSFDKQGNIIQRYAENIMSAKNALEKLNEIDPSELANAQKKAIDDHIKNLEREQDAIDKARKDMADNTQKIKSGYIKDKTGGLFNSEEEIAAFKKRQAELKEEKESWEVLRKQKLKNQKEGNFTNKDAEELAKYNEELQKINKQMEENARKAEALKGLTAKNIEDNTKNAIQASKSEYMAKNMPQYGNIAAMTRTYNDNTKKITTSKNMLEFDWETIKTQEVEAQRRTLEEKIRLNEQEEESYRHVVETAITLEQEKERITEAANSEGFGESASIDTVEKLNEDLNKGIGIADDYASSLGKIADRFKMFFSLGYIFDKAVQILERSIDMVKTMDKDMTQIGLVLGQTSGEVWKNFGSYSKMAEELGTTTQEVTASMKLFYQQGLSTTEVTKMVRASAVAAALGESSMAEASETLTSIINSYNLSATEAMSVTDKISAIAIKSAADFGELSTAIEKVASSAATAGLDLDHMMGYLAKMIETTREAPANIGTSLKTITANFTQFKENPEAVNEDGFTANKVDKALQDVGIELFDKQTGQMKDLGVVIDELGMKWEDLTRNQKAYLATAIAGNRQSSRFYALMNNYDRTLQLVAEGTNSAGSAQRQYELYTQSLQASINRLTVQWEKFYNSLTNGNGIIRKTVDLLTQLLKVANLLGPVGSGLAIFGVTKGIGKIVSNVKSFKNIGTEEGYADFIKNSTKANQQNKINLANRINNPEKYGKLTFKDVLHGMNYDPNDPRRQDWKLGNEKAENKEEKIINSITPEIKTVGDKIDEVKNAILGVESLNNNEQHEKRQKELEEVFGEHGVDDQRAAAIDKYLEENPELSLKDKMKEGANEFIDGAKSGWEKLTNPLKEMKKSFNENGKPGLALQKLKEGGLSNLFGKNGTLKELLSATGGGIKNAGGKALAMIENTGFGQKLLGGLGKITTTFGVKGVAGLLGKVVGLGGPLGLLVIGVKTVGWLLKKTNQSLALTAKQKVIRAEQAKEKSDSLKDAQTRFNELSLKVVRTKEEERELSEIIARVASVDKNLSKELSNNRNSLGIDALDNKIKELNKDEAKWRIAANKQEANGLIQGKGWNWGSSIGNFFSSIGARIWGDGDGSYAQKQNDSIAVMRNNANYLSTQYDLNAEQMSLINKVLDAEIDKIDKNGENQYANYKGSISSVTNTLEKVAKSIQDLNISEKQLLDNFITKMNSGNYSYNQLENISKSETNKNVKDLEEAYLEGMESSIKTLSKNTKVDEKQLKNLSSNALNGIVNIDTSDLDEDDKKQIYTDQRKLIENYSSELELTGIELTNFYIELAKAGEITSLTAEKLTGLSGRPIDYLTKAFDNTKKVLDNYKNLVEGSTQSELLQKISEGKINSSDVSLTSQGKIIVNSTGDYVKGLEESLKLIQNSVNANKLQETNYASSNAEALLATIMDNGNYIDQVSKAQFFQNYAEEGIAKQKFGPNWATTKTQNPGYFANEMSNYLDKGFIVQEDQQKIASAMVSGNKFDLGESTKEAIDTNTELGNMIDKYKKLGYSTEQLYEMELSINEAIEEGHKEIAKKQKGYDGLISLAKKYERQIQLANKFEGAGVMAANINNTVKDLDSLASIIKDINDEGFGWVEWSSLAAENPELAYEILEKTNGDLSQTETVLKTIKDDELNSLRSTLTEINERTIAENERLERGRKIWNGIQESVAMSKNQVEAMNAELKDLSDEDLLDLANSLGIDTEQYEESMDYFSNEAQGLTNSLDNWETWGNGVTTVIAALNEDLATTQENLNNLGSDKEIKKTKARAGTKASSGIKENKIAFQPTKLSTEDRDAIYKQIDTSKTVKESGKVLSESAIDKMVSDAEKDFNKKATGSSSGSGDSLDEVEKFYYYLQMIEKIEKELSQLDAQQSFRDAASDYNYNTTGISEQLSLLEKEYEVYGQLNIERGAWLEQERASIEAAYSWAHFTEDGMLYYEDGLKLSSEQQKRVDEYASQWSDNLDAVQKRQEILTQQVEKIKQYYEKINKEVTDAWEGMDKAISHSDWWAQNGFSDVGKVNSQINSMSGLRDAIKLTDNELKNIEKSWNDVYVTISNKNWGEYLQYNGYLNQFVLTEAGNNLLKTNETLYNEISKSMTDFNGIANMYEDSMGKLETYYESIQNQISTWGEHLQGIVDRWYGEMDSILQEIDKQISDIDLDFTMNGVNEEGVEDKETLLAKKVVDAEQMYKTFTKLQNDAENQIKKNYKDYVYYVNGEMLINEAALETTTDLTEKEKANFRMLATEAQIFREKADESYQVFTEAQKAVMDELINQRDNYIDLLGEIQNELKEMDQEELDDLRKKYDEMKSLDDEYYSSLEKKIQKQRDKREEEQSSTNINQLQQRIAVLQKDNSGKYSSELSNLQSQLRDALQNKADKDIDNELKRIKEEQEDREKARELEETQLENLISFKEENRIYWKEAEDLYSEGIATITGFLGARYQDEDISDDEMIKKTEEASNKAVNAYGSNAHTISDEVGSIYDRAQELIDDESVDKAMKTMTEDLKKNYEAISEETDTLWEQIADELDTWYIYWKKSQAVNELKANSDAWWRAYQIGDEDAMERLAEANENLIKSLNEDLAEHGLEQYTRNGAGVWTTSDGRALYLPNQYAQTQDNYAASYNNLHDEEYRRDRGEVTESEMKQGAKAILDAKDEYAKATTKEERDKASNKALNTIKNLDLPWSRDDNGNWHASDGTIMSLEYLKHLAGYSTGGLVDYTGLAMVHGSQNSPEAFLNAKQTALFAQLRDGLVSNGYKFNNNHSSDSTGDTININGIEIAVKELAEIEDVNKIVDTVKQSIYKDATSGRSLKLNRR